MHTAMVSLYCKTAHCRPTLGYCRSERQMHTLSQIGLRSPTAVTSAARDTATIWVPVCTPYEDGTTSAATEDATLSHAVLMLHRKRADSAQDGGSTAGSGSKRPQRHEGSQAARLGDAKRRREAANYLVGSQ